MKSQYRLYTEFEGQIELWQQMIVLGLVLFVMYLGFYEPIFAFNPQLWYDAHVFLT